MLKVYSLNLPYKLSNTKVGNYETTPTNSELHRCKQTRWVVDSISVEEYLKTNEQKICEDFNPYNKDITSVQNMKHNPIANEEKRRLSILGIFPQVYHIIVTSVAAQK